MTESPETHLAEIADKGFTIIRDVLDANDVDGGQMWQRIPVEPRVLSVVEGVLGSECLISSLSSIRIRPAETAQPVHSDDQVLPIEEPTPPLVCNTMWALTDFTEDNGATRIVPGSHRGPKPRFGQDHPTVAAEMSRGDVLVWHGRMWHGGGANSTDRDRIGIAMNYCAGWIRQQENQQLGLPPELVATFSPRLAELVGYGTFMGLVGHIEKQSPVEALLGEGHGAMLWDRGQHHPVRDAPHVRSDTVDEDTEGHGRRAAPAPSDTVDDDTEGHARRRP